MKTILRSDFVPIFYGVSACSWMPHLACHYYRLETDSSFVVGNWSFSPIDSLVSMIVYAVLIVGNLLAISVGKMRASISLATGMLHVLIGSIHVYRLWTQFRFEVFGHNWPYGASAREVLIVVPFGFLCILVASQLYRRKAI
jgi:hypothetical protein